MGQAVLTADEDRERLFRRAVGISAAAHVVLLLLVVLSPFPHSRPAALPGVMSVSLVAAAPSGGAPVRAAPKPPAPAPKAKPAEPKPVPPPEPPKPEVKADKKLLPKEATQAPKPKPKPAVAPPQPKPPKPMDYDDALDSLRQELGEGPPADAPDPELVASVHATARSGPPGGGGGGGDPLDPLTAEWMRRVKIHVTRAWVLEPSLRRRVIQAEVNVTLDASGNVLGVDLTRGSGVSEYDTSVMRAIQKASPLPPPPESGEWPFVFTPQDVL